MMRIWSSLLISLFINAAQAASPGQDLLLPFGGSSHYLGASGDYNFATGQMYGPPLSDTRAGSESEICNGALYTFPANTAPITPGCGVWAWETRTNLFLNNQAPVTQTITVASGSVYTISFYGTGVLTLSGACTNVETGSAYPTKTQFSCVAATTSLVTTVTTLGTINYVQVELNPNATTAPQGFATGPILTSGAAVTRNANVLKATVPCVLPSLYVSGTPAAPAPQTTGSYAVFFTNAGETSYVFAARGASGFGYSQVPGATTTGSSWPQNLAGKLTVQTGANLQSKFNGALTTSAATIPTGISILGVGVDPVYGTLPFNGVLSRVAVACNGASLLNN